jgi:hypothetical protein
VDKTSMTYSNWRVLAYLVVLLIVASVGINFATGQAFGRPQLEVERMVECYQYATGLEEWDIETVLLESEEDDAASVADPVYMTATIWVDPTYWAEADDWHKRELIGHEVLHVRLWEFAAPLWEIDSVLAAEAEENLVTELSRSPIFMEWRCP